MIRSVAQDLALLSMCCFATLSTKACFLLLCNFCHERFSISFEPFKHDHFILSLFHFLLVSASCFVFLQSRGRGKRRWIVPRQSSGVRVFPHRSRREEGEKREEKANEKEICYFLSAFATCSWRRGRRTRASLPSSNVFYMLEAKYVRQVKTNRD